jgi:signal transduction histidine kinase
MKVDFSKGSVPFDLALRQHWPLAEAGFLVNLKGPNPGQLPINLQREEPFLLKNQSEEVYTLVNSHPLNADSEKVIRFITPQRQPANLVPLNFQPELLSFSQAVGDEPSGILAHMSEENLHLLVWQRQGEQILGAEVDMQELGQRLGRLMEPAPRGSGTLSSIADVGYCVAILNDQGRAVACSRAGFVADWKRPLVSTEISRALPLWEAGLFLTAPDEIHRSARTLQVILCFVIFVMFAAIAVGGAHIATGIRQQLHLAQQKTDFVSNVSHELKTPLTSIRMFSELLIEGRVTDPERRMTYLKIISAEAARLTRLINNVLDFAKPDRRPQLAELPSIDFLEVVDEVVEITRPHLESLRCVFRVEREAGSLPIRADRDALSQVLLNLLSNAEKYGGKDISLRIRWAESVPHLQPSPYGFGVAEVLDAGPGIPPAQVDSVFRAFVRLHDTLSSGIPGTGLGLTLARKLARENGGDVLYSPRAEGGSCFSLILPLERAWGGLNETKDK